MPKISEAELEVLKVLWEKQAPVSSALLNEYLKAKKGWEKSTVRTLVRRLVEKGVLIQQKKEMYYYIPAVTEEEHISEQTHFFLEKLYKGNAKNLVANLVEQNYINCRDLDELKAFWGKGEDE